MEVSAKTGDTLQGVLRGQENTTPDTHKLGARVENRFTAGMYNELFTYVSDGKDNIATAITDKGIDANGSDTFEELADKIRAILGTGGYVLTYNGGFDGLSLYDINCVSVNKDGYAYAGKGTSLGCFYEGDINPLVIETAYEIKCVAATVNYVYVGLINNTIDIYDKYLSFVSNIDFIGNNIKKLIVPSGTTTPDLLYCIDDYNKLYKISNQSVSSVLWITIAPVNTCDASDETLYIADNMGRIYGYNIATEISLFTATTCTQGNITDISVIPDELSPGGDIGVLVSHDQQGTVQKYSRNGEQKWVKEYGCAVSSVGADVDKIFVFKPSNNSRNFYMYDLDGIIFPSNSMNYNDTTSPIIIKYFDDQLFVFDSYGLHKFLIEQI